MYHGNNDYPNLVGSVEYVEWQSLKNDLTGSVIGHGKDRRSIGDPRDGIVNSVYEGCGT
jgi:hypothetical protein